MMIDYGRGGGKKQKARPKRVKTKGTLESFGNKDSALRAILHSVVIDTCLTNVLLAPNG